MYYRYVLKELSHHRQRMLVNCLGIAVGIALFVSINAVSAAYREAVSLPFKNLGADLVVQWPEMRAVDSGQPAQSMRGIRLPISARSSRPMISKNSGPFPAWTPSPPRSSSGSSTEAASGRSWGWT